MLITNEQKKRRISKRSSYLDRGLQIMILRPWRRYTL
nr:MAG TPA: hypothetical protein [Caudoviricetes sp.]